MTAWLVKKNGSDNNGGTSASVLATDTDGATNVGNNNLTSVAAKFTAGMVGAGIFIGGVNVWRLITAFNSSTSITYSGAAIATASGRTWTIGGAFQTVGKVVGATIPIASGDQSYIGAGVYRESLTFATTFTSETKFTGDIFGQFTGDAGTVEITDYTTDDRTGFGSSAVFGLNTRNFVTFERVLAIEGNSGAVITATAGLHDITFNECVLVNVQNNRNIFNPTTSANVAANFTFNRCIFVSSGAFTYTLTRPTTADFDYNIANNNCIFLGDGGTCVAVASTGANTFNGGGVHMDHCTALGKGSLFTTATNNSTTIPCTVNNSISFGVVSTTLNAATLGQIIEDYNIVASRTNVTAGAHSQILTNGAYVKVDWGQSFLWGMLPRAFLSPLLSSPVLGFGASAASVATDLLNTTRPYGTVTYGDRGTATAGAATTLTDTGKVWGVDAYRGWIVRLTGGTGSGQVKRIISNTTTALTVDGSWITNPDSTSVYLIYYGPLVTSGKATAGSTTTLTDSGAAWGTTQWVGYTVNITAGTGSGQTAVITSHTATVLTFAALGVGLDNTSQYQIYQTTGLVTGGIGAVHPSVGALERPNGAFRETTVFRTTQPSWGFAAGNWEEYEIAVAAVSTTISVWARYDANYAGTLPQLQLLANGEIGVAAANATCVGAAGSFEQLQLTFTPTAAGKVKVRFASLSTAAAGLAFFDDWSAL